MKHLFAVLVVVGLLTPGSANARNRLVCGLNRSGMSLEDWARTPNHSRFEAADISDRKILAEMQRVSGTNYRPDERKDLGLPPAIWLIDGASNAFAGGSGESATERSTQIILDDGWLKELEAKSSSARWTVLAHELGHLAHGDVWGQGASSVWQREYAADVFAGSTMCQLGVAEESVRDVYGEISEEMATEDPTKHPSLKFRLQAIAEGYHHAGCN
jgi:hypothetical protein